MRAYSEDLRKKIVAALEQRGMSKAQGSPHLLSEPLLGLKRYARTVRQGGSLTPKKEPWGRTRKVDEKAQVLLKEDVKERPAATISQRRRFLEHITGKDLSDATVRRLMKRLGFSQKTDTVGALERDEFLRAAWRVMVAQPLDARRVVFVDEMGTNISLSALYALAPKGQRALCVGCLATFRS